MSTARENRAWHVAGHAFVAMSFGFPVEKLTLNGFSASDLEHTDERAQRLDAWTMIRVPKLAYPPGTFQYTRTMEHLCRVALAGPIAELIHRQQPCSLPAVQQHEPDWNQAWRAAGSVYPDDSKRLAYIERELQWGKTYMASPSALEFLSPVVCHLLTHGTMTASETAEVWEKHIVE